MTSETISPLHADELAYVAADDGATEPMEVPCPQCGVVRVAVRVIVDFEVDADRSAVEEAIRNETLQQAACPTCGSRIVVDAPLLVFWSEPEPFLVFSPAQGTNAEEDQAVAKGLIEKWQRKRGKLASTESANVIPILRERLAQMVSEGASGIIRRYTSPDPGMAIAAQYLKTYSWHDAYRVIREQPNLLQNATNALSGAIRDRFQALKHHDIVTAIDESLTLLERCEDVGIENAFSEKIGCSIDALVKAATNSTPSIAEIISESINAQRIYYDTGDVLALDKVASWWNVELFGDESPNVGKENRGAHIKPHARVIVLDLASQLYLTRYSARVVVVDLHRAKTLLTQLIEALPADVAEASQYLCSLGSCYRMLYNHTQQMEDLQKATAFCSQALDRCPVDAPRRAGFLAELATSIRKRYEHSRRVEDLTEAIAIYRQALDIAGLHAEDRLRCIVGLGNGLMARYERIRQIADLEDAILLHREALDMTPRDSIYWANNLWNLGQAIFEHYKHTSRLDDLYESIDVIREALHASSHRADKWQYAQKLGECYLVAYERTGRMKELEEAILIFRQTIEIAPEPAARSNLLSSLGMALRARHQRIGRLEDLEEAIGVFREVMETSSRRLAARPGQLNNLATCLRTRYECTGSLTDLEEAIALFQDARATIAPDAPERDVIINNLAAALRKRSENAKQSTDLQEAIALFRYNLEVTPGDSPNRHGYLFTLGNALGTRYLQSRRLEDLQEAISVYRQGLAMMPANSPERPTYLKALGQWLVLQYETTERIEDLMEANGINREAATLQRELDLTVHRDRGHVFPTKVSCANCGQVSVNVRLIVDLALIENTAEVVEAIRQGTIHRVDCTSCGNVLGVVDMPLLVYCPGPVPQLYFSPDAHSTAEEDEEMARRLVMQWQLLAGDVAADPNLKLTWIRRAVLAEVLDKGAEAGEAKLREWVTSFTGPLEAVVRELLAAKTPEELYRAIRSHPELVDEPAETMLTGLLPQLTAVQSTDFPYKLEDLIDLLRRCRDIGVLATFAEQFGWTPLRFEEQEAMTQLPESMLADIRQAKSYQIHYQHYGNVETLDKEAACWERVLSDPRYANAPLPAKVDISEQAGILFLRKYFAQQDTSALNRAVTVWQSIWSELPVGHFAAPIIATNLGTALTARYQHSSNIADLKEAIAFCHQAVTMSTADTQNRHKIIANLGHKLCTLYESNGQIETLEEAVATCHQAVDIAPTDPMAIEVLARVLHQRYTRIGRVEDLDETISYCRQARDPIAADRPVCLSELGIALITRYNRSGNEEDLEAAIAAFRQDLEAVPAGSSAQADCLDHLGAALNSWYKQTGMAEDLDESITLLRRAAELKPNAPGIWTNLATALGDRHRHSGRMEDMQERIALNRRAVAASAVGSQAYPDLLNNLGVTLCDAHQHTHREEDLAEAIELCRRAVEATPADSPDRPSFLGNLAYALNSRYAQKGEIDDLHEAVMVCRQSVNAAGIGSPIRALHLNTLGNSLSQLYQLTAQMNDLDEAIGVYRDAVREGPSPDVHALHNLALALCKRYQQTSKIGDLQEAITSFRQVLERSRVRNPGIALTSAQTLGSLLLQLSRWDDAAAVHGDAMSLMDTVCDTQILRSDKHSWLRSANLLYANAAYAMVRLGDLEGAVLALETGRARVLTEMLDRTYADLDEIEKRAPELVHRYREMLAHFAYLEKMAAQNSTGPTPDKHLPNRIREARVELHAAVEAIRAIPGYGSFLARASVPALFAALEPSVPVIYVAATPIGGMALVVSKEDERLEVSPVWLDSLKIKSVHELLHDWLRDYSQLQRNNDSSSQVAWHRRIDQTTRALWDLVTGPIIDLLRARFPRIEQAVLIPNGLLSILPLHAAWTDAQHGKRRWALDEVAFRYAPSVRALGHARDTATTCGQTKLLVIDDPRPTAAAPLPSSQHEVKAAIAQFASAESTLLAGESCLRADVLAAIEGADVCHFACHGANDWHNPLRSGVLMAHDEMLTVEDLLSLSGKQGRMAVLSACETGIVGTDAPNEVVALPAAFLQAGFAGVVASLWSVYDISASLLMARFYELWLGEHVEPTEALRKAQIWLRDLKNHEIVTHLEQIVPELVPRMALESAETLHLSALVQDPNETPFAHPVHWAAFYLTGA